MSRLPVRLEVAYGAEVTTLDLKDVLVVRGLTDEACERLALKTGRIVIILDDGQTLETLDEADMLSHGWIRLNPNEQRGAG